MRRNKMGAVKVGAYVGTQDCRFDSKAEYRYALWLEKEREAGRIRSWVHHPDPLELSGVDGTTVCMIAPDFLVQRRYGVFEYHEVKGMATAAWRLKRALFEREHKEFRYVVIDAGQVDPPALFDERRKRKAAKKRARAKR